MSTVPSAVPSAGGAVERHAQVVDVAPGRREDYLALHRAVWPAVEQRLRECHITNYSIFLLDDTLFAYYEYVGEDHEADQARIAADPVTREWWTFTDPCQTPFGDDPTATGWRSATEVWHLAP